MLLASLVAPGQTPEALQGDIIGMRSGETKNGHVAGIAISKDEQSTFAVLSDVAVVSLRGGGVKRVGAQTTGRAIQAGAVPATPGTGRTAGDVFRDCGDCPEMVVIPAGTFTMGSLASEDERDPDEGPTHPVNVRSFALGKYEVTRAQFQIYVTDTGAKLSGCSSWNGTDWELDASQSWQAPGFDQTPDDPVLCVNWDDATGYAKWLAQRTKQDYRLASEAEWEYAARAKTTSRRFWGDNASQACTYSNVADETAKKTFSDWAVHECSDGYVHTAPAGRLRANPFALHDMLGNALEWVQDCYHDSYVGAPTNGEAWTTGDCGSRVLRGGSWRGGPRSVRSAIRVGDDTPTGRGSDAGFRVARTL